MKPYKNIENLEVGIDEAGRGCLFGRVYVGSAILPDDFQEQLDKEYNGKLQLRDSKKVNEKNRALLRKLIEERAIDYSVCYAEHDEIEDLNILYCTLKTMHKCVDTLTLKPDYILVDGDKFNKYKDEDGKEIKHECVTGGDDKYHSIAAASILAKEYRDEYIRNMCEEHPILKEYDIPNNKGYGTQKHRDKIKELGNTEWHRKTFGICKEQNMFSVKDSLSFTKQF
jgi:ribonuclease HII